MRRDWRRFGSGIALCAAVLVVGTAAALAATAGTGPTAAPVSASSAGSADLAGSLRGPCILGIIGDCARPTPTFTVPSSIASTPGVTPTDTTAPPSREPTPSVTRPRHPHSDPPTDRVRVRTTAPGPGPTRQHPHRSGSVAVAVTNSVDPTPAGTTLSASDVPPTHDAAKRVESSGMWRPLMQFLPIVAIFLAVGVVVIATAARRGSRRNRAAAGHVRPRHRHTYSETDELAHPRALR